MENLNSSRSETVTNVSEEHSLPPYVVRLVEEYKDISEKVEKLKTFIVDVATGKKSVQFGDEEIALLNKQIDAMIKYQVALEMRLRLRGLTK